MAQRVRIKLNNKGFEQLRRAPGVKKQIKKIADDVAADAGSGYASSLAEGRTRSRASVITTTPRAMVDNSKNSTLITHLYARRR